MTGEFVIKQAGFYRELGGHGHETASAPSLRDAARSSGDWDEDRLVAYLEASHEIYTTMGAERDVIADDVWITGAGSLVTDGTFVWPTRWPSAPTDMCARSCGETRGTQGNPVGRPPAPTPLRPRSGKRQGRSTRASQAKSAAHQPRPIRPRPLPLLATVFTERGIDRHCDRTMLTLITWITGLAHRRRTDSRETTCSPYARVGP